MVQLAAGMSRLGTESAFEVLARAKALEAQGRPIINLGIGQPDFRTPEHIVDAAIKALKDGHHGYTPANGILPLRESVAADLLRLVGEADEALAAPGRESEASSFYNDLVRIGERPHLAALGDDLRDRALVGLAHKLRQRAREGSGGPQLAGTLLGQSGEWSSSLVRDADFATRAVRKRRPAAWSSLSIAARMSFVCSVTEAPRAPCATCPAVYTVSPWTTHWLMRGPASKRWMLMAGSPLLAPNEESHPTRLARLCPNLPAGLGRQDRAGGASV